MAMDPVTQTLAQQNSGSAQGQGFGQFFVQGQQLAQGRRQLNLAQQRIDIERSQEKRLSEAQKMLLPLQVMQLKLTNAGAGIELANDLQKLELNIAGNAALPEINALKLEIMRSPEGIATPGIIDKIQASEQRYGKAFTKEGPGGELMALAQIAAARKQEFNRLREMLGELPAGSRISLPGGGSVDKDRELDPAEMEFRLRSIEAREREQAFRETSKTADLALRERVMKIRETLPPVRQKILDAKLKAIEDDPKLINKRDEKNAQIEALEREFSSVVPPINPGGNVTPAPLPGATNGTPRLRWDPATRRLIPTTNAPSRGLSPNVDALDPVTVP